MITKEQFLIELGKLSIDETYFNEVAIDHVKYVSMDDPFAEEENSFLTALVDAAKNVGARTVTRRYRDKFNKSDRTINALRKKHKDFTTKGD